MTYPAGETLGRPPESARQIKACRLIPS